MTKTLDDWLMQGGPADAREWPEIATLIRQREQELAFARDALRRIYNAAAGILDGEENPVEAAEDIQRMAINGIKAQEVFRWSHLPREGFD